MVVNKKIILVMGPPGCGKGTQAAKLKEKYGIVHISTGDLFRAEVGNKTPLGIEAKKYMDAGKYVPDEITIGMLHNRIKEKDCAKGFILDGFPRTIPQAEALDKLLKEVKEKVTNVIYYNVADKVVVARIKGRAEQDKKAGKVVRADDTDEKVIKQRLDTYHTSTKPVLDHYAKQKLVLTVNAEKTIDEIFADVVAKL
jgi:adenylate kinase